MYIWVSVYVYVYTASERAALKDPSEKCYEGKQRPLWPLLGDLIISFSYASL